jgi:hypothetical protein
VTEPDRESAVVLCISDRLDRFADDVDGLLLPSEKLTWQPGLPRPVMATY